MDINERLNRIEQMIMVASKNILNIKEMAMVLGISESRLRHICCEKEIPYYKQGRRVYFKKSEVEDWMLQCKVKSNAEIKQEAATYIAINH